MYRFLVVIEKANKNYSAYSPDLPGCVATGETREKVEQNIYEAIEMHIQGLLEDRSSIPKPHAAAEYLVIK
ncbi:MAG: type II toxin-antitoxin system HicB family antitoxin [Candidatus Latescibacteria bacterium]|nr:type II toxin-antitoxin system HicB family antitoxin [Candidatus Latescibacterota bacterium]